MAIALWPAEASRSATLRTAVLLRSTSATAAPASANASAVASPMREAAPVTRAVFPSNDKFIIHSYIHLADSCRLPLLLWFFENLPRDRQGGVRRRPAGIEGEVGNRLDDLVACHTV